MHEQLAVSPPVSAVSSGINACIFLLPFLAPSFPLFIYFFKIYLSTLLKFRSYGVALEIRRLTYREENPMANCFPHLEYPIPLPTTTEFVQYLAGLIQCRIQHRCRIGDMGGKTAH